MNALKKVASMLGGAAVLAAITGLAAGVAPASAAPHQTPGSNLYIYQDPANPANWALGIEGVFPMSEYDAHGFINNINTAERPGGVNYTIIGDDPDSKALYGRWFPGAGWDSDGGLYAQSDGIRFTRTLSVPKSTLNEDDGIDEIYVYVGFVEADGGVRRAHTNVVHGNFD